MLRVIWFCVAAAMGVLAHAQITVPASVEPYQPIIATCDVAAADANVGVQVLWEADDATAIEVVGDGRRIHCWAPPGEHSLRVSVFRVDWESREFRVEQYRAAFRVLGAEPPKPPPDPEPPTPPVPVGKLTAVILHETEDDTPEQGRLFVGLRAGDAAKWIRDNGHKLLILDDDAQDAAGQPMKLAATLKALGVDLPALFVLDEAQRVLHKQTLPATTTADNVVEALRRVAQ